MTFRVSRFGMAACAVAALTVAVTAACGNETGSSTATATAQPQAKPGTATKTPAAVHTEHAAEIDQQDLTFIPARVSVKVGETVLIKNSETAIHTGNVNGENVTGNMKKGANIAWTAKTPGEYAVTCDYHPQMKATIIVTS